MSSLLEVSGVSVSFDGFKAINNLSFRIGNPELRAIIGPNGAGKSTLMKSITGVYSLDEGNIRFQDQDVTSLAPGERRARGIEMIYQDLALAPQQDIANNIFWAENPPRNSGAFFQVLWTKKKLTPRRSR